MRKYIYLLLLLFSLPYSLYAQGIELPFQGIRTHGMGNTYSGFDSKAEVVWHNPAAMSSMGSKIHINAGFNAVMSNIAFQLRGPSLYMAASDNPINFPVSISIGYSLNEKINLGVSVNSVFNQKIKWQQENWAGKFIVKESNLTTLVIQPAASLRIFDFLSLGAGMSIVSSDFFFTKAIAVRDQNQEGSMNITGRELAIGFNAGLFYAVGERLNIGLSYKSGMQLSFDDSQTHFLVPSSLESYFGVANSANVVIPVAGLLDLTGGWKTTERLNLAWGISYRLKKNNEDTHIDFAQNSVYLPDFSLVSNYSNDWSVRMGVEYLVTEFMQLRAGGYYQVNAGSKEFFSPHNPWGNRIAITSGASVFPIPGLSVDLSIIYLAGLETHGNYAPAHFAGTYKSSSFIPGLGLGYAL